MNNRDMDAIASVMIEQENEKMDRLERQRDELLAALGYEIHGGEHPGRRKYICVDGEELFFPGDVQDYLDTAEGQRAVEDRLEQLCDELHCAFTYSYEQPMQNSEGDYYKRHRLNVSAFGKLEILCADSRHEAWQVALIWLDERKGI
ncbi:MAG: hypothetical protein C4542_02985 [Dehalococcoidia bacterium]|nr:MAG: hypothetical protein C4542_02985 [Dehalococcoidia bacterium]